MIDLGTKIRNIRKRDYVAVGVCTCIGVTVISFSGFALTSMYADEIDLSANLPTNYSSDYVEIGDNYEDYEQFEQTDWEEFKADPEEEFTTVEVEQSLVDAAFVDTRSSFNDSYVAPSSNYRVDSITLSDEEIIMLPEADAWQLISNGIYTDYPSGNFLENKQRLIRIRAANSEIIKVKCWYWKYPDDSSNFEKVTKERTFTVNSAIAGLFKHAFEDIYNDPSQPVLNLADGGMGTWVIRGKNHNSYARMSTHSLGCCIDINPSTGSFCINGKWFGNGFGQNKMTKELWEKLPECHKKYHVLYEGSPIVEIFKSYGFVWGGDWSSAKDPMHISWIGEGKGTRKQGQANYKSRKENTDEVKVNEQ